MGQFGFGHFAGRNATQFFPGTGVIAPPGLQPSSQWTGAPGTGFSTVPVDPARLTAKPALRLIEPPNQYYTSELIVGALAFANDGGTLIGAIDRVRFHFEGSTIDVMEPTLRKLTHADGTPYQCLGYWVSLRAPVSTRGHAHLYIEAIPADATMQRRVIGPFRFSPQDQLHDHSVTVAPSQPQSAGVNYHSVGAALDFLKSAGAQNPLVTITEPLIEDFSANESGSPGYEPMGYATITATAPVTFAKSAYTTDVAAQMRSKWNQLRFKGPNITFDMRYISGLRRGNTSGGEFWLDGCRFINSEGRYSLWRKTGRPLGYIVEGSPWFTEVEFVDVPNMVNLARLARGCKVVRGYNDFCGDGRAVIYNRVDGLDSTDGYLVDVPALRVEYTGPESTATFAKTPPGNTQTFTARWGANSENFKVGVTEAYFTGATGDGYHVQDVADWLNGLPGWNATVIDDTRAANHLSMPEVKNIAFTENVKDRALELVTLIDFHGDFYQQRFNGLTENCIIAFNHGTGMRGQNIFLSAIPGPANDFIVIGNAFANVPATTGYALYDQVSSQLSRSVHSHTVFAHNSMPTQLLRFRTDQGFAPDRYCLIANNALLSIVWNGAPETNLVISNNAIDAGENDPSGAEGTVIAGDYTSKFVDMGAGDFTPAGELLANLRPSILSRTLGIRLRAQDDAIGALPVATL